MPQPPERTGRSSLFAEKLASIFRNRRIIHELRRAHYLGSRHPNNGCEDRNFIYTAPTTLVSAERRLAVGGTRLCANGRSQSSPSLSARRRRPAGRPSRRIRPPPRRRLRSSRRYRPTGFSSSSSTRAAFLRSRRRVRGPARSAARPNPILPSASNMPMRRALTPVLKAGPGLIGTSLDDPLGATFAKIWNGNYNYVVWNDQFYQNPVVPCAKGRNNNADGCGSPWGHSKGVLAWNDAGEGMVVQVTTPSWPGAAATAQPRPGDGNTLGCIKRSNNLKFSQHFFALRLNAADVEHVVDALANASVVTDVANPVLVRNGGPDAIKAKVALLGRKVASTSPVDAVLSTGVRLIGKPSGLNVPAGSSSPPSWEAFRCAPRPGGPAPAFRPPRRPRRSPAGALRSAMPGPSRSQLRAAGPARRSTSGGRAAITASSASRPTAPAPTPSSPTSTSRGSSPAIARAARTGAAAFSSCSTIRCCTPASPLSSTEIRQTPRIRRFRTRQETGRHLQRPARRRAEGPNRGRLFPLHRPEARPSRLLFPPIFRSPPRANPEHDPALRLSRSVEREANLIPNI